MKILKEGTPAKAVISCPHCKCEMEYTNLDLYEEFQTETYNYLSSSPATMMKKYYIKCPCCGEHIPVSKL